MNESIIQIYTGNGKGKTTAAFGVAFRAAGHGMKTLVLQFLKNKETGEKVASEKIEEITVEQYGSSDFIVHGETDEEDRQKALKGFKRAERAIIEEDWDVVVLDEMNLVLYYDLIKIDDLLHLMDEIDNTELIITGRKAPDELVEKADLVTSMEEIKHPYMKGLSPRKGIEY